MLLRGTQVCFPEPKWWLTISCSSSGGGPDALFRPPLAPDTRGAHTFMQAKHSYTENKNLVVCQNTLGDVKPVLVNITAEAEQMAFRKQRLSQYSFVFIYVPSTGTSFSRKSTVLP